MKKLKNLVVLYPTFGTGGVTNNLVNFLNFSSKKKIKAHRTRNQDYNLS